MAIIHGFESRHSLCDDQGVMTDSLYWYDFETTGTDPARDRAIQFAGVRTDLKLNTVSEPVNVFCYPGNDTVPDPEAILVTGIQFSELRQKGMNEAAFSHAIHQEFATPSTCVVGFNNLRFDDEFIRNLFYRNFHDPYAREWQNENSRWDVIDMFRMAHALRPDGFEWPKNEEGVTTFRLEKLTQANDIGHESAHNAVSDVVATIEVTRKLKKAQPKLYDYLFSLRQKREVLNQLYPLGKNAIVHVSAMYPAQQACLALVLPLCSHPTNQNGVICYDLARDPRDLIDLNAGEIHRRVFSSSEELGDLSRIPLKTIHVNRSPAIAPLGTIKGHEDRLGIRLEECLRHMKRLQQASGVVEKLDEVFSTTSFKDSEDPDLMLYQGGFFSTADKEIMDEVRSNTAENLSAYGSSFQDERLPEMLFRYRARNFPDSLSAEEKTRWDRYRRKLFSDEKNPSTRLDKIAGLRETGRGAACLDDLEEYLRDLLTGLT